MQESKISEVKKFTIANQMTDYTDIYIRLISTKTETYNLLIDNPLIHNNHGTCLTLTSIFAIGDNFKQVNISNNLYLMHNLPNHSQFNV